MLAIKSNETSIEFGAERNTVFVLKRRAAGTVLRFKCLDDRKTPAPLMNCAVTLSVRRAGASESVIRNAVCELHPNQFDNAGEGFFVFDDRTADLIPGDYDLEIRVTGDSRSPRFYPSSQTAAFARLIVHDSIS